MREVSCRLRRNQYLLPVVVLRPGDFSDLELFTTMALVDTGATVSGIGPQLVDRLRLRSYGKNLIGSVRDEAFADYYLFRIGLFSDEQLVRRQNEPGDLPFIFDEIDGFSWPRPERFEVLLGMDVLSRCDVHLDRHGACRVQFGA